MPIRTLSYASLLLYIVSLAATQTTYGKSFLAVRWISLIALSIFCAISWAAKGTRLQLESMNSRVLIYLLLWGMTVIAGAYPLYSSYRFLSHALIVVSSLIFLPQIVQLTDAPKFVTVLKVVVSIALVASYLWPADTTYLDDPDLFHGVFGNPNALGHMAAVGCLLFLHGYLTNKRSRSGYIHLAMAVVAATLLLRSGARSSLTGLLFGLLAMFFVDRRYLSRNILILWFAVFAGLVVVLALPSSVKGFVFKKEAAIKEVSMFNRLGNSRIPTLTASWEAFKERPLMGWGFGVDKETDLSKWNGQLSSIGFTVRDPVNDFTYTLETGGVVGLLAYLFMLSIVRSLRIPEASVMNLKSYLGPRDAQIVASAVEAQQVFYCLTVMLIVLFECDDSALSAGNFFAAILWVSLGLSASLRSMLVYDLPQRLVAKYFGNREPLLADR